jgi:cysteinyl-tRNA synthetase
MTSGTAAVGVGNGVGNGGPAAVAGTLSDEEIEKLIADRAAARRAGDYARADEIRANLLKAGVILDDTRAGARWKRK